MNLSLQNRHRRSEQTLLVITGGTLIDGTGNEPLQDSLIVVKGNRIESVSEGQITVRTEKAKIINVRDRTILPGLIDVHVHVCGSAGAAINASEYSIDQFLRNLEGYLLNGVTSIKSVGDPKELILAMKKQENREELEGPRVFAVGPLFTAPGGHPVGLFKKYYPIVKSVTRQINDLKVAVREVKKLAREGVDGIKVVYDGRDGRVPKISAELLKAIIDEAKNNHLRAVVHTNKRKDAVAAALAGADGLEHGVNDVLVDEEAIAILKEKNVFYVPTLAVLESFFRLVDDPHFLDDPILKYSVNTKIIDSLKVPSNNSSLTKYNGDFIARNRRRFYIAKENLRRVSEAGIKIAVGSDSGNPMVFHGQSIHRELELVVEAGMTTLQAILASTRNAAYHIGASQELGSIEKGKLADLIIVNGDPLKDIRAINNIETVIKNGKIIDRKKLSMDINPVSKG